VTALRTTLGTLSSALLLAGPAAASPTATSISATDGHTCASMSGGEVDCWGASYLPKTQSNVPVQVSGIVRDSAAVQASIRYNCALLVGGKIECWGDDGYGQLGNGRTEDSATPVKVRGIANARAISTGGYHACAVLASGGIDCWGRNVRGALGDGSLSDSSTPVPVSGITNAVSVSAGYIDDETCAVLATGTIKCWGSNKQGQLGDGTTIDRTRPVTVEGITNATAVAAAGNHACAVLQTGALNCWGANDDGQLGNGTTTTSLTPTPVKGLGGVRAVAVDPRGYSCAALQSGAVYCWGHNPKNQLGNGHQPEGSLVPVRVLGVTSAISITTGMGHACALLSSGAADCWGYDDYGQLGVGDGLPKISNPAPVRFGWSGDPLGRERAPSATSATPGLTAAATCEEPLCSPSSTQPGAAANSQTAPGNVGEAAPGAQEEPTPAGGPQPTVPPPACATPVSPLDAVSATTFTATEVTSPSSVLLAVGEAKRVRDRVQCGLVLRARHGHG
jgi:alpha-tubulin suppressor-like RCC1 family protein